MHVIWKRPDGFQNALPKDFRRVELSNGAHLWLHQHEIDWYPFQVSGDWSGQNDTKRLNQLVNLLDADSAVLKLFLEQSAANKMEDNKNQSVEETAYESLTWIKMMEKLIKGNTWEIEIIRCALMDIENKLQLMCTKS